MPLDSLPADRKPANQSIGANNPPLDNPADLAKRLEKEGYALLARAASLDMNCAMLPEAVETEPQAAMVTDAIAKAKTLVREIGVFHVDQKAPYLAGGRVVDAFKTELTGPLETMAEKLTARLNTYQRALRARAEADQRAREAEERERERLALVAQETAAAEARAAEKKIADAAEAMRAAKTTEERDAAEAQMRDGGAEAVAARAQADEHATVAAEANRTAEVAGKAASGQIGQASRITAGGASAGGQRYWNHRIDDASKFIASLGPLGAFIANDAVTTALNGVKRALGPCTRGAVPSIVIPGVVFFDDFRTTVTAARPASRRHG